MKRTAAIFSTPDEETAVYCAISKTYPRPSGSGYWFAFHPKQKEELQKYSSAFVCFGCGSAELIIKIPAMSYYEWLDSFNVTDSEGRFYWHVIIDEQSGRWRARTKQGSDNIELTEFLVP